MIRAQRTQCGWEGDEDVVVGGGWKEEGGGLIPWRLPVLGVPRVPADGNEVMDGANMFASRFLFISQSFDVESHE